MSGITWKPPNKHDSIPHATRRLRCLVVGMVFSGLLALLLLSVGPRETFGASLAVKKGGAIMATGDGAQIGDRVWRDANRNGIQDSGEAGMVGITVTLHLSGTGVITATTTDAAGIYTFTHVISGTYAVEFERPTGYVFSPQNEGGDDALDSDVDPVTGLTPYFEVAGGAGDDTWDAGLMPRVVSDKVHFPIAMRTLIPPLLVNGGFEHQNQGWNLINQGLPASIVDQSNDPSVPRGTYSALLGRADYPCSATGVPLGHAAVEQSYVVPQSSQHVTLRFKYIVWSQDASTSGQYDRFEVFVAPQGGAASLVFSDGNMVNQGLGCNVWRRVPGPENPRNGQTAGWAEAVVSLDSYKGQTVTFSFRNYSRYDGWYNTYTYLDDVRVVFGN
jgi:hypothetical protein